MQKVKKDVNSIQFGKERVMIMFKIVDKAHPNRAGCNHQRDWQLLRDTANFSLGQNLTNGGLQGVIM